MWPIELGLQWISRLDVIALLPGSGDHHDGAASVPLPAIVVTIPVFRAIMRIRRLLRSATYSLSPDRLRSIPNTPLKVALVAGPPSPEYPASPVPAIVEIAPLLRSTLRMR